MVCSKDRPDEAERIASGTELRKKYILLKLKVVLELICSEQSNYLCRQKGTLDAHGRTTTERKIAYLLHGLWNVLKPKTTHEPSSAYC